MRVSTLLRLLGCLALVAGCGPSEGRFLEKQAKVSCERALECYADAGFASVDDCRDTYETYLDEYADYFAGCAYSAKEARGCLRAYRGLPCEPGPDDWADFHAACEDVWVCGS